MVTYYHFQRVNRLAVYCVLKYVCRFRIRGQGPFAVCLNDFTQAVFFR